jgi:hypothetical protein
LSQTSLIYRSAAGYELIMRALYGRHYRARLQAVADQIPPGSSVLELCPGPGALYERHLRRRGGGGGGGRGGGGGYLAADVNPRFVERLKSLGAEAVVLDVSAPEPLPPADVVVMQASLYHFLPDASAMVDRMLAAARDRVVLAEPIRNLSSSRLPGLARLSQRSTDPGAGEDGHEQRFDEPRLDALMARYAGRVVTRFKIPGGREKVYVLQARLGRPD